MRLHLGQRTTEWVKRLPAVVAALNGEVTRLTGKRPSDAIKAKTLAQKPSSVVPDRPVGLKEQWLPSGVGVRYLYQPGQVEGGRCSATDPVWSLEVCWLGHSVTKPDEPVLYYLQDGPLHGFVREELLVVPPVVLFEEGLFVLLMSDVSFHDILFHTLCLLDAGLKDRVHLRAQTDIFGNGAPCKLVLHLPQHFFIGHAVQGVLRWVVRGVIELCVGGHVPEDILGLDLEEETVGVGVEELATIPVLRPELVEIEVIHQVLGEIQNAHPHEHQAIVDVDSCRSRRYWPEQMLDWG